MPAIVINILWVAVTGLIFCYIGWLYRSRPDRRPPAAAYFLAGFGCIFLGSVMGLFQALIVLNRISNTTISPMSVFFIKTVFGYITGSLLILGGVRKVTMTPTVPPNPATVPAPEAVNYKELYEQTRQASEVYRSLINSSADAIVLYDLQGVVKFVNPTFTAIFGWDVNDLNDPAKPFIPESEQVDSDSLFKQLADRGTPCQGVETKRIVKDGGIINVHMSASRYDDHEGNPAGVLAILRDISNQKSLETRLLQAQKLEAIGTLAGGIAHDFNNLLMAIQGNTSLMLLSIDASHPNYTKLKNIEHYIQSGAGLTKQLLGFARDGKFQVSSVNINNLVQKTASMFGRTKKEIHIHTRLQDDIWEVEVDPTQIEQVMLNLFINAWQAMPTGGKIFIQTTNIQIKSDQANHLNVQPGRYVRISVIDSGLGMDAETQQRIFDPFFTTKKMGGSSVRGAGLGLASAYGIIKSHGGIIDVQSEEGRGTTFSIYLPAPDRSAAGLAELNDLILEGSETIMVIDDEEMILVAAREMLEQLGYTVITVTNGPEAINIFRQSHNRIDLVILDLVMPDMDGKETYDALMAINSQQKVLLATGYSLKGQASEIIASGCDGFLQKPFTMKRLSVKIRDILDGRSTCLL